MQTCPVFYSILARHLFHRRLFADHLGTFILTMIGSTLVISVALMLNSWYEVDLDKKMERTQIVRR